MAVQVMAWVFANSRSRNGQRLVMLAVADACNKPDGTGAWLSNAALCAKTGLSERAVQVAVRECEALGELAVRRGSGRGGVNAFTVLMAHRKGADSAPLSERAQNLRGAESAGGRTDEEPQVREEKGAESAGFTENGKGAESAPGTVRTTTSKKKRPRTEPYREDVERVCTRLADKIEATGSKRPTITDEWRKQARLLLDEKRPDPVDVDRVLNAIDWATSHHFWHRNILSMPTLRKQWDRLRLDRIAEINAAKNGNGKHAGKPGAPAPIPRAEQCPDHRGQPGGTRDDGTPKCGQCRALNKAQPATTARGTT